MMTLQRQCGLAATSGQSHDLSVPDCQVLYASLHAKQTAASYDSQLL